MGDQLVKLAMIGIALSFVAGLTVRPKGSVAVINAITQPFKIAVQGAGGQFTRVGSG